MLQDPHDELETGFGAAVPWYTQPVSRVISAPNKHVQQRTGVVVTVVPNYFVFVKSVPVRFTYYLLLIH